jgi:hypothetical protein
MAINPVFLGHGIFAEYGIKDALQRFEKYGAAPGSPQPTWDQRIERFVQALQDMEVATLWLQLFSRGPKKFDDVGEETYGHRKTLLSKLSSANIKWVGWGYTSGKNWQRDKDWISELKNDLGMSAYVIDAEPGNKIYPNPEFPKDRQKRLPDIWKTDDFERFTDAIGALFGKDNLAVSTWPVLQIQNDPAHGLPVIDLMKIAAPKVCLFAPQAYWMNYPGRTHYATLGYSEQDYPSKDPASFVRLVIQSWKDAGITNPLVITGQAYWGEGSGLSESTMSAKVKYFTENFRDWNRILGFNWYHAGKVNTDVDGSMSDKMVGYINAAHLGSKPYLQPHGAIA